MKTPDESSSATLHFLDMLKLCFSLCRTEWTSANIYCFHIKKSKKKKSNPKKIF